MNPRASDRVRGFQDTIIVVGDARLTLKLGTAVGAEIILTLLLDNKNIIHLLSSLVKRVTLLIIP